MRHTLLVTRSTHSRELRLKTRAGAFHGTWAGYQTAENQSPREQSYQQYPRNWQSLAACRDGGPAGEGVIFPGDHMELV